MAQNGFNRRPNTATRTYPGTASRLLNSSSSSSGASGSSNSSGSSSSGRIPTTTTLGSIPSILVRPLSHSQLASSNPVRRTINNEPSSSTTNNVPPVPPARPISLDQPRPSGERHRNLYMGAPLPSHHQRLNNNLSNDSNISNNTTTTSTNNSSSSNINTTTNKIRLDSTITAAEQVRLPTNSRLNKNNKNHSSYSDNPNIKVKNTNIKDSSSSSTSTTTTSTTSPSSSVVTCQPKRTLNLLEEPQKKLAESSIICPYCRKCRCEACATPRPLPSRWICSKSIHCGPEPLLDYITCLCCVKALFYHCGKNHEPDGGVLCADKPCSCAPHRKFWRWGCMATMSLMLPCLCLYWPCKGCLKLVEKGYQKYHDNGCNCHQNHHHLQQQQQLNLPPTHRAHHTGAINSIDGPIPNIESSEDEDTHKKYLHQKRIGDFSIIGGGSSHQQNGKISKLLPATIT